jgi:hypothetical protein
MRSKYSVSHSERVANADKTIEIHGVTLEKNVAVKSPFYHAKLTDDGFAAFWSRVSNAPAPKSGDVGDFHFVRFDHLAEPYVSLTIPAEKALDLVANGAAVEGLALQPAIAG